MVIPYQGIGRPSAAFRLVFYCGRITARHQDGYSGKAAKNAHLVSVINSLRPWAKEIRGDQPSRALILEISARVSAASPLRAWIWTWSGEIKSAKADIILMNQQYSPRTDFMFDGAAYTDNIRWVSQVRDVSLFNRYEIMKYWAETGVFDLSAMRNDGVYEKLHRCLGGLLSDFIIRAGALPVSRE